MNNKNALCELVELGQLSNDYLADICLTAMSEEQVEKMIEKNDLTEVTSTVMVGG